MSRRSRPPGDRAGGRVSGVSSPAAIAASSNPWLDCAPPVEEEVTQIDSGALPEVKTLRASAGEAVRSAGAIEAAGARSLLMEKQRR